MTKFIARQFVKFFNQSDRGKVLAVIVRWTGLISISTGQVDASDYLYLFEVNWLLDNFVIVRQFSFRWQNHKWLTKYPVIATKQ